MALSKLGMRAFLRTFVSETIYRFISKNYMVSVLKRIQYGYSSPLEEAMVQFLDFSEIV